jgi:hypothetical protein
MVLTIPSVRLRSSAKVEPFFSNRHREFHFTSIPPCAVIAAPGWLEKFRFAALFTTCAQHFAK